MKSSFYQKGSDHILNIAIVAFNYELSKRALWEIANNDTNSKIKVRTKDYIIMEDGTKYKIFPTYNHVRGHCIDQLIIVDDDRWEVYNQQHELIDWIKYRMFMSCVPEEFQIQEYEW